MQIFREVAFIALLDYLLMREREALLVSKGSMFLQGEYPPIFNFLPKKSEMMFLHQKRLKMDLKELTKGLVEMV